MNCIKCKKVLGPNNRSGACSKCKVRCPICGTALSASGCSGWCLDCYKLKANLEAAHAYGAVRPPPGEIEGLIAIYSARADAGEPLFSHGGRRDPVRLGYGPCPQSMFNTSVWSWGNGQEKEEADDGPVP